ncbi:hypothetical protein TNCV_2305141 [Trichonephila clavipes]|nr:hypothetical protein TNCV_2305141 [Trichonephila clavipes]
MTFNPSPSPIDSEKQFLKNAMRVETNGSTCHTSGLRVGCESSQMVQDDWNGKMLRKLVSFESGGRESIFMVKECVRICIEQTACSEIVSLFSIRQKGCRKPQYDRERLAKFFNDRHSHGTNWRNDSK